jgi:phospholipid transport system substrate-binding protein
VHYNQEIIKSDTLAEVYTTLTSPTLNVPIIYYMIRKDASWKVYDVSVENVSLVKNYRSQFRSILQNNSPDHLIATLKEKTNE